MGQLRLPIIFILLWGNVLFIRAARKDICDRCVKIDDCPIFANMNTRQQQIWLEQVPCEGPANGGGSSVFGFSPVAKGDYVCCPSSNVWGIDNGGQDQKQVPIRPNDRRRPGNYQQPGFNNQYPFNGQQNGFNGNPQSGSGTGRGMENQYGQQPGASGQGYGNPQNGLNNQGNFGNTQNPNFSQFPNNINDFFGNPQQNGQYPNGIDQNPYGQFPNVKYPGYSNTGGQNGWGNGNFNQNGYEQQCPSHTDMIPDPSSGCCGKDLSDSNTITDLQRVLNMYAPSNSNRYPRPSYSPPQRHQTLPNYPNRQRRSVDFNDTSDGDLQDRISGGKETELDQFPWTVLLKITFDYGNKQAAFNCGGSLISQRYVLTAGHCVYETGATVSEVEITLSEYDKRTFPRDCRSELGGGRECVENIRMHAEDVIHHPKYDDDQLHNDIALIKIRGYAPYTRYIRPICLPPLDIDDPDLSNLPLAVAGWGRNGPYETSIKQSTVVHLVPHDTCMKSYPQLTVSHLCAAGRTGEDTCKGDSGGPLMMLYSNSFYVIGIVSGKRADSPCGTSVPSLYTNVYQYVPWITSNMEN